MYTKFHISPICQRMIYNTRELEATDTIGSLRVLAGDTIKCIELEEKGDFEDVNQGGEGFGGTGLLLPFGQDQEARVAFVPACPDCTFENPVGASSCEMCGKEFLR